MSSRTLSEWLSYIESQHPSVIELGLERCSEVLSRLPIHRPLGKVFTVAGTNGKGSTCAMLTQYLTDDGDTVGTFTSPHFLRFNERIAVHGEPVDDATIVAAFEAIESVRGEISLTYFEFNTLAALFIFSEAALDHWVLEVGLGGRLDSVNMIDADIAIITSIALDHTDWLGDTLELIAREKAGIARAAAPLISGVNPAPITIEAVANDVGAVLYQKGRDFYFEVEGDCWSWRNAELQFSDLPLPHLPVENAATVIAALYYAGVLPSRQKIVHMLHHTRLMGRFQKTADLPLTIVDVAHNPEAAMELSKRVATFPQKPIAVCGMLKDKDIQSVVAILSERFAAWYLADLHVPRGAHAADIAKYLQTQTSYCYHSVEEAYQGAKQAALLEQRAIIVFGSFHTVADYFALSEEINSGYV